jgi:hypothetical protein
MAEKKKTRWKTGKKGKSFFPHPHQHGPGERKMLDRWAEVPRLSAGQSGEMMGRYGRRSPQENTAAAQGRCGGFHELSSNALAYQAGC